MEIPWEAIIGVLGTLLGTGLGVWLSHFVNSRQDKTKLTWELHRDFYTSELSKARSEAAKLIEKYPYKSYKELDELDSIETTCVWETLGFFQRLSLSLRYKKVDDQLTCDLFAEAFYWWYFASYEHSLVPINEWESSENVIWLKKEFHKKIDQSKLQRWEKYAKEERQKFLDAESKRQKVVAISN